MSPQEQPLHDRGWQAVAHVFRWLDSQAVPKHRDLRTTINQALTISRYRECLRAAVSSHLSQSLANSLTRRTENSSP